MVRRHRRAGAWSPPLVAAMARSLAREGRREAGRLTALADRARRINEPGYAAALDTTQAVGPDVAPVDPAHVVRGHWTHQPHGPQRSLRRLQWIDDYTRGPQDTPLTTRTHVWAWRHQ